MSSFYEERRILKSELEYLLAGLEESKCVVLVVGFSKEGSLRRRMTYISPNAKDMGINQSVLVSGFRLPEDYIHIEDRAAFVEAVSLARRENRDISYEVRIIGDDGIVRNVDLSIKILNASEDEAEIVFFVREKDSTPIEELAKIRKPDYKLSRDFMKNSEAGTIFRVFSMSFGLYSAIVDRDGRIVAAPTGPSNYVGVFYDVFERPEYSELFAALKKVAESDISDDSDDRLIPMDVRHPDSRITMLPIVADGKTVGYWILAAFTEDETLCLSGIGETHRAAVRVMGDYVRRHFISEDKINGRAVARKRIEFEMKRHEILEKCVMTVNDDRHTAFTECFKEVGELFDTGFIGSYRYKHGRLVLTAHWMADENSDEAVNTLADIATFTDSLEGDERKRFLSESFIVDKTNVTNKIRVTVFKGLARAMIVVPIIINDECVGQVAVIETKKERVWSEEEIDFVRGIVRTFGATQQLTDIERRLEKSNISILDVLNYLNATVFIRDYASNKVLFSSDALNKALGKDFTGMDSRLLIQDDASRFAPEAMLEKMHKVGTVREWQKYMDLFGGNVNIIEVDINWHNGVPAVLYILKKVKDGPFRI